MKPLWLIVEDSFPDDLAPLLESLENSNTPYTTIKSDIYFDEDKLNFLVHRNIWEKECVVYYGPLNLGKWLIKNAPWTPGVYYNVPKYECLAYYSKLGKYLLNDNYIMLPWG